MPEGGAIGEPGEQMWRDNGKTVMPYLSMAPPAALDCASLASIRAPQLVVQGANTDTRFAIMAGSVASCVANGLLVELPDANHDGPYRRASEFGSLIGHFLSLARVDTDG